MAETTATKIFIGVGAGCAAFYAVPVAVTAIGFGSGGVVAGTTAASMMSSMGTSGTMIPVLQSIGATGAIAKSTAVAVGAATTIMTSAAAENFPRVLETTGQMAKSTAVAVGAATATMTSAAAENFPRVLETTGQMAKSTVFAVGAATSTMKSAAGENFPRFMKIFRRSAL